MSNQKIKSITIVDKRDNTVIFTSGEKKDFIEIVAEYEPEKPKNNVLFVVGKPDYGVDYSYIDDRGNIDESIWYDTVIDNERLNLNNIFLTKENARKQADRNQLLAEIERFAVENNEPQTETTSMWCLAFTKEDADIYLMYSFYFTTEEIKTQALEKFKDRLDILLD